jgi:hypothetical protein
MVQAVSWRLLTAGARFQSQVSPCKIYGVQSGTVTGFSRSTSVFPVSIIPPMHHTHLYLHCMHPRRTDGQSLGTFQKAVVIGHREAFDRKVLSLFLV